MTVIVKVPRVNANEDQLQVVNNCVQEGQHVAEGDLLFVLETTKSAIEMLAPASGVIHKLSGILGDFVDVGMVLCEIVPDGAGVGSGADVRINVRSAEVVITAKGRKLAAELGVDLMEVMPVHGRIGRTEVLAVAAAREDTASASAPAVSTSVQPGGRRAVIVGGGGHAACLIDALLAAGYDIVGCTDTIHPAGHHVCGGVSVIGSEERLVELLANGVAYAFVGIGGAISNEDRSSKFKKLAEMGFILPPVIHPLASVAHDVRLGRGCQILSGATIGPRCTIGDNVIVNQGAIVCHDCALHDHVHLTPGAILAGAVIVGPMTVIGMGATVLLRLRIGANCLIHNGAHIGTDVADDMVVDAAGRRSKL